jgi:hypothetical protein
VSHEIIIVQDKEKKPMKSSLPLALIIALGLFVEVPAVNCQMQTRDKKFYSRVARNLVGEKIRIPQDLKTEKSCVVLAFERNQQSVIDTWIPYLLKLEKEKTGFAFYEVPVIQSGYKPVRWFIDGAMANSIKTDEGKKRTVTSYTNVSKFVKSMQLNKKEISLFIVTKDGSILAEATGAYDEQKANKLLAAL